MVKLLFRCSSILSINCLFLCNQTPFWVFQVWGFVLGFFFDSKMSVASLDTLGIWSSHSSNGNFVLWFPPCLILLRAHLPLWADTSRIALDGGDGSALHLSWPQWVDQLLLYCSAWSRLSVKIQSSFCHAKEMFLYSSFCQEWLLSNAFLSQR